ncbi:cyclic diguanylate phosphodiesterase [Photobacterium halotolerans]|uniref:EAL domain-containing protein n=1 Tax=Photobacterium halotolerans TaxID=265726 RepID=UPI0013722F91|nr:cyclic diguanylate phosphodiesterase [Photobacterium halotolerans]NAW88073.1 EAL domain-containing protein [Photobacterium halotolerans]
MTLTCKNWFLIRFVTCYKHFLLAMLLGLSVLTLGLGGIYLHGRSNLEDLVKEKATIANALFQNTIDEAHVAINKATPLLGAACTPATAAELKRISVLSPNIRTVNLVKDDYIYCSSLFSKALKRNANTRIAGDSHLFLATHNYFNPNEKILFLSSAVGETYAIASIDVQYIKKTLKTIGQKIPLTITLNNQQRVTYATSYSETEDGTLIALNSRDDEFTISSRISQTMYLDYMLSHLYISMSLCVIIAIVISINGYRQLKRPRSLQEELRRAVKENEFLPYLQPIVNHQGRVCGAEILMRWHHPNQGFIMPDLFIPLAEDTGLINVMTTQALTSVKSYLLQNHQYLPDGFHLAINISPCQCNDLLFYKDCLSFMSAFPEGKVKLVAELTEREFIKDTGHAALLFEKLHNLGVQIALDDFGTGHSSLAYINQFNIDIIKIDKSFTHLIGSVDMPSHIVDNVVDLANRLNIDVVAEGVENATQETYLKQHNIQFFQGYLYDKPLPPAIFMQKMKEQSHGQKRLQAAPSFEG